MKRINILIFSIMACVLSAAAQPKVAVFDPICDLPTSSKTIIREKIVGIIASSRNYIAVERSLISKVMEENKFQAQGLVEESQQSELGRKAGANLVCIVVAVRLESDYYVSVKLVNLLTAQIEKQRSGQTSSFGSNIEILVQNLATEIFTASTPPLPNVQSKIAVFDPDDPEGNISAGVKSVIREEMSNVIVNNPSYLVLERANFDKVMQEYRFQGNYSDNSQELGKKMGAKYVCVITVVRSGSGYTVICKQIDVESAVVEKQGDGKVYSVSQIPFAAKEAAMIFAANPEAAKREIAKTRNELEKVHAEQLRAQAQAAKESTRETKKAENKSKYNYFGYGVGTGITYGTFGMGIIGRYGGVFGVGYEGGIGYRNAEGGSYFHWSAGLRLYPFKFIYFSANYGVIGADELVTENTSDGHFSMAGTKILNGISFMGGVNIKFAASALTLGVGVSLPNDKLKDRSAMMPAWNVAYSVAF